MGAVENVEDLARRLEWRVSPERIPLSPATPSDLVSTKPLDECRFDVPRFPGFRATQPSRELKDLTWNALAHEVAGERPLLLEDKERGDAVLMCALVADDGGDIGRRDECVGDLTAMAVDLDKVSEEDVHRYLGQLDVAEIEYLAYTTHSHGKDGQSRYRIVLPLDTPVPPPEFRQLAGAVNSVLFDGQSDTNFEKVRISGHRRRGFQPIVDGISA